MRETIPIWQNKDFVENPYILLGTHNTNKIEERVNVGYRTSDIFFTMIFTLFIIHTSLDHNSLAKELSVFSRYLFMIILFICFIDIFR